jgi:hypothetical protein
LKIKKVQEDEYILIIDSREFEAEINFKNIEEMEETMNDLLSITFLAPGEGSGYKRVTEIFECYELDELLSLYGKIKS